MILSDKKILKEIKKGNIVITPFDENCIGPNSYDAHLSKFLAVYTDELLDAKKDNPISLIEIPEEGYILQPGELYLGSTVEYTENYKYVPYCEGRSSTGRLGMAIHVTAGKGDVGFKGHWTLEITVVKPLKIYRNMKIAQLTFFDVKGKVSNYYNKRAVSNYNNYDPIPRPSRMFKSFNN